MASDAEIVEHMKLVEEIKRQIDLQQKRWHDAEDKGDVELAQYYRGDISGLRRALNMLVNGVGPSKNPLDIKRS